MVELSDLPQEIFHRCGTHPNHPTAMYYPYITHAEFLLNLLKRCHGVLFLAVGIKFKGTSRASRCSLRLLRLLRN